MNFVEIFLTVIFASFAIILIFFAHLNTYWKKKGVRTPKHLPIIGHGWDLLTRRKQFGEVVADWYNEFKLENEPFCGGYILTKKCFIPIDLRLIKSIMQTDFPHFVNHGFYFNEKLEPLSAHLFALEDNEWRNLRSKLTPSFTSGKIKSMFSTLTNCADQLGPILDKSAKNNTALDIGEVIACYTTDVIGSVAFGIECNSIKNPDAEFRKYGRMHFECTTMNLWRNLIGTVCSKKLLHLLRFKMISPEISSFFLKSVHENVDYRIKNGIVRKDFLNLLLQMKESSGDEELSLTTDQIAAQCFVFFLAGFETTSTTLTFTLFELSLNKEIQKRLREELVAVLAKYDNKITYDSLMELTYMDQVINETLRKYPPVPNIPRSCTMDYKVPDSNVTLDKGITVIIPTLAIHRDPEYYPNPDQFDPERFSEENKYSRPSYSFIPFGEGPRICIGMRLAMIETKVGLATILRDYEISLNNKTKNPIVIDTAASFTLKAQGSVWIDVQKIGSK